MSDTGFLYEDHYADATHDAYEQGYADGQRDAVKHGKWIFTGQFCELNKHQCSVCNREEFTMYNYCPHCGAKMDIPSDQ